MMIPILHKSKPHQSSLLAPLWCFVLSASSWWDHPSDVFRHLILYESTQGRAENGSLHGEDQLSRFPAAHFTTVLHLCASPLRCSLGTLSQALSMKTQLHAVTSDSIPRKSKGIKLKVTRIMAMVMTTMLKSRFWHHIMLRLSSETGSRQPFNRRNGANTQVAQRTCGSMHDRLCHSHCSSLYCSWCENHACCGLSLHESKLSFTYVHNVSQSVLMYSNSFMLWQVSSMPR